MEYPCASAQHTDQFAQLSLAVSPNSRAAWTSPSSTRNKGLAHCCFNSASDQELRFFRSQTDVRSFVCGLVSLKPVGGNTEEQDEKGMPEKAAVFLACSFCLFGVDVECRHLGAINHNTGNHFTHSNVRVGIIKQLNANATKICSSWSTEQFASNLRKSLLLFKTEFVT